MILLWIIAILVLGGLLSWAFGRWSPNAPRWIAAAALGIDVVLVLSLFVSHSGEMSLSSGRAWLVELVRPWIPGFGISLHLALDGLSLLLVALSVFLGFLSVLTSWTEIKTKTGFFYFNLLWVLAGIIGVFSAVDLFLLYFFWELMLVPMYFLIGIWGHANRIYAAFKFFLFTQASGLALLISILALYFIHGTATGVYSFDYAQLLGTRLEPAAGLWLMIGFSLAFIVKIAGVPVHTWLPDAHAEAPTAGSIILAGLLLKTGAYGLLRFVLPFFPSALKVGAPVGMVLGVIGILYGAKLAFAQSDLKRLIAYTSVSHMGFVMLGIFALNSLALQGAVLQMICHGISTGALFMLAGVLQERIHTRDMRVMGGLWEKAPRLGAAGLIFALASLGLPGLGNFVAEFVTLFGSFRASVTLTVIASLGLIASTIYALSLVQRVFHGPRVREWSFSDLGGRELLIIGLLVIAIVWLGIYPQPVLNTAGGALTRIQEYASPDLGRLGPKESGAERIPGRLSPKSGARGRGGAL